MNDDFVKRLTELGYFEAIPRPRDADLEAFYREIYFKPGVTSTYQSQYSDAELRNKRFRAKSIVEFISKCCIGTRSPVALEIGSGEGFLLASALERGWTIRGVDYQAEPIIQNNPDVILQFTSDDPQNFLNNAIGSGHLFDVLILQNVLEHVLDPAGLLRSLRNSLRDDGCIFVQVPNDYSDLQTLAIEEDRVNSEYWFLPPQHLNYFNSANFGRFVNGLGFEIIDAISDFPIEMYLWGGVVNYSTDKSLGRYAHIARVTLDNFISESGVDKYLDFYRAAYSVGLGRNICCTLKKS